MSPSRASTSTRAPTSNPTALATSPGRRTARFLPQRPTMTCDIISSEPNIPSICKNRLPGGAPQPPLPPRPIGGVVLALHLVEARDGAAEFETAVAVKVDLLRQHRGRGDEEGARLVERVDQ